MKPRNDTMFIGLVQLVLAALVTAFMIVDELQHQSANHQLQTTQMILETRTWERDQWKTVALNYKAQLARTHQSK